MSSASVPVTEGFAPFSVPGLAEPCKTYYKIFGSLSSAKRTPLIVVHGGPGIPHMYLLPIADLASRGIPVVFYDQIGCGRSTHLPEKNGDTAFWTDDLFVAELANLRKHLNIGTYDALGHSWGGMLLARVASVPEHATGLRRLVLASAPSDLHIWADIVYGLRDALPKDVQVVLDKHEKEDTMHAPEYQAAVGVFYARHVCRVDPMPEEIMEAIGDMENEPTVYHTMYGKHEFDIRGPLKDWTVLPDIHKITAPTFVINGRYDEAQDPVVRPFFDGIPRVKWYTFADSSHMPHYEERDKYMQLVDDFLSG